ncbi:BTAD domain-containing putative transcriptional regulator [Streptomyces sp. OP7]|uniref:AfsR/SARP family transcriptional regulator n=1 Tax=Streptomyces sp. OP7 TaxID=3142462 RepID=UPI0032E91CD8
MHAATDQPPAPEPRMPARPSATATVPAADGTGDPFAYAVLGPVRVSRHGEQADPGSPQQRAVLVALLLREGRRVSVDELIDAVWGGVPPRSAAQTIRTYVHRLRRALAPALPTDPSPLVSDDYGYALRFSPDRLDLHAFRRRVAGAEAAADRGDHATAVTGFRDALTLWRGEALAGIPGEYAAAQRAALEAARLSAVEKRIRSEWELGRHGESSGELAGMVAAHPLNERYREMLMLALCRSGRRAEALEAYREARAHLVRELGVEPGARLRELHERIRVRRQSVGGRGDGIRDGPAPARRAASGYSPWLSSTVSVYHGDTLVGRAENASQFAAFDLAPGRLPYRLVLDTAVAAQGREVFGPYSTATRTEWRFHSEAAAEPRPVPLVQLDYGIDLDAEGRAKRTSDLVLTPVALGGDRSAPTSVRLDVSYDDGATWQRQDLREDKGSWRAKLKAPSRAGYVSLRVVVGQRDGDGVTQTVTRAFGLR